MIGNGTRRDRLFAAGAVLEIFDRFGQGGGRAFEAGGQIIEVSHSGAVRSTEPGIQLWRRQPGFRVPASGRPRNDARKLA
jgi:hypothetical protein